jgi:hypothetical protein
MNPNQMPVVQEALDNIQVVLDNGHTLVRIYLDTFQKLTGLELGGHGEEVPRMIHLSVEEFGKGLEKIARAQRILEAVYFSFDPRGNEVDG